MKRGRLKPVWRPNGQRPGDQVWEDDTMSIPKEFAELPHPEPETLLWSIETRMVGASEDDPPVRCLFFLGEGIELKDDDEARIATAIEKVSRYAAAEIEQLRSELTKCKARMQIMREWMRSGYELMGPNAWPVWDAFLDDKPEAAEWFDDEGMPK